MDAVELCASCGGPLAPRQEYCLECGARVLRPHGVVHKLGTGWKRRLRWYPGDWIWPSLAALVISAAGAAAAIASTGGTRPAGPETVVAISKLVAAPLKAQSVKPAPEPARTGRRPAPKPPPRRPASALIQWPAQSGYSLVLASLPIADGGAQAKVVAHRALQVGLTQVGILISSRFASLHPGYYVVFSGVYGSLEDAQAALPGIVGRFPNAYARQITR